VVREDGTTACRRLESFVTSRPFPGLVELDAGEVAAAVLGAAQACLAVEGPVTAVGVTNQRGTTVVWDATTGEPVGPALSWQDLRTAGACLELQREGLRLAPNESATKLAWLLDDADPGRHRDLRFGTLDSWVTWVLTEGRSHVTDVSNAAVSGLLPTEDILAGRADIAWSDSRLERFRIPSTCMPALVGSSEVVGEATALPGAPPVAGLVGDQQGSLLGQGCVNEGDAKATFGTGAFLDLNVGGRPPAFGATEKRGEQGCLPIVAWQRSGTCTWGAEALVLSAGTAVQWLVDDLGLISSPDESAEVAARCTDTGDVYFVPALMGLGTPQWDFGARSLFIGMSTGTGRPELVRAVLRGVAQRGADMLAAVEADSGHKVPVLRVDGGMSANEVFLRELADACQVPLHVSAELEATSLGAAYLAGLATGIWSSEQEVAGLVAPRLVVEPGPDSRRDRWKEAVSRSVRWIPELSALQF
jgi:glycerol kinase